MYNLIAAAVSFKCPGENCTFSAFIYQWQDILNLLTVLLASIALVVFFSGIVKFIFSAGDTREHAQGYRLLSWGIVAMFLLIAFAGVINFFATDIFPSGGPYTTGGSVPSTSQ